MFWQSQRITQIEEINTTGPSFELRALFLPGAAIDMVAPSNSEKMCLCTTP